MFIRTALHIIWQSTLYRLRRREANNLIASVMLMVAFDLGLVDLLHRTLFALVLNIYVYLMNDYCDIDRDLGSSQKDHDKARFMGEHRAEALAAVLGLGGLLLGLSALHSLFLVGVLLANTLVVWAYSAWLKQVPITDILLMSIAGATMTAPGIPPMDPLGWKMLGFLGLICASFEVIQVVRDEPGDREAGVATTAVLLGAARAAWVFRGIVLGTSAYVVLVVGSLAGLGLLIALVLPLTPERASRTWDIGRLLFGAVLAILLVQVRLGQFSL